MNGRLYQLLIAARRDFREVRRVVALSHELVRAGTRNCRRFVVDTFDNRLLEAGRWVELEINGAACVRLRGSGADTDCVEEILGAEPAEPLELPHGALADILAPIAGGRALLRRREMLVRVWEFHIVDAEGKIRAHLTREQITDAAGGRRRTLAHVVRLWPLRGYEKWCGRLHREIIDVLGDRASLRDPGDRIARSGRAGVTRGSSKDAALLTPRQSVASALAQLLLGQLRLMEANIAGMRADTDNEFLHDFRVACRRSRSLLIQVRGAFPQGSDGPFREAFSWLSRVTSPQRDLDVFLAALPALSARLRGRHARALAPLAEMLHQRRHAEHERLVQSMADGRFVEFFPNWRDFLNGFTRRPAAQARGAPRALDAANESLRRLHRRLLRTGERCGDGRYSPELHELRKDGKKLRYLLEGFRSLYPTADVDKVVGRLRKLQVVLGDIVDCHVQREWLAQWRREFEARAEVDTQLLAAMTALAAELDRLEQEAQHGFLRRFGRFTSDTVRTAVDRLLAA
jgi:CHAD domain-containing protein